ncbi:MAG: CPBP family intramembrane metalloprotease [Clostridiales bacterium]|nr:CPBP family intramembrane metalloprotease [Clostridiales bacterium]
MAKQKDFLSVIKSTWTDYIFPFLRLPKYPDLGLLLTTAFGFSFLIQTIWQNIPDEKLFFSKTSLIGYSIVTLVRLMVLLAIFVFTGEHFKIKEHHLWGRDPGLGGVFMSILAGVPAMLIATSVHNLFIFFELQLENPIPGRLYYYVTNESSLFGVALVFIITILLPAIVEELFFRGLLFSILPDKWWIRIPVPALLSTLFATNKLEFLMFLVIGLFASGIRYFTGNVLCSCAMRLGLACASTLLEKVISVQDPSSVQNSIDYSRTVLYASYISLGIGIVMMLVLFRQLRYFKYLQHNEDLHCNTEEAKPLAIPVFEHLRIGFFIGVALIALCWLRA